MPNRYYDAGNRGAGAGTGIFSINVTHNGDISSNHRHFYIPGLAFNHMLGELSSLDVAVYGNSGQDTKFNGGTATFSQNLPLGLTGINALGGVLPALQSHCDGVRRRHSATWQYRCAGFLRQSGRHRRCRSDPVVRRAVLLSQAHEFLLGRRWRARVLPMGCLSRYRYRRSYQSRVYMTKFKKYTDLFAGCGEFDIQSNSNLGLQLHPFPRHRFTFDLQRINYREVSSVGHVATLSVREPIWPV